MGKRTEPGVSGFCANKRAAECRSNDGPELFEGPAEHRGTSSLRPLASASREISIDAIALDELAGELGRIDCIKIDVEGAEMRALTGMSKLVDRDHPSFIIEFTDEYLNSFGDSAATMAQWLVSRGYQLYRIEDAGLLPLD